MTLILTLIGLIFATAIPVRMRIQTLEQQVFELQQPSESELRRITALNGTDN